MELRRIAINKIVEDPDQRKGEVVGLCRRHIDRRAALGAGSGQGEVRKVGVVAGAPSGWLQIVSLALLVFALRHAHRNGQGFWRGWVFAWVWLAGSLWWLYVSMHTYGGLASWMAVLAVAALSGCSKKGELVFEEGVGIASVLTLCPAVGIPDYTGDVTTFRDAADTSVASLDVSAAMTNLRATCNDTADQVYSEATFTVNARRSDRLKGISLPAEDLALRHDWPGNGRELRA